MLAIKTLRKAKKMTQSQLAKKSEVSQAYISQLERDERTNPSKEMLEKIAKALGTTVAEVMKNEGDAEDASGN